MNPNKFGRFKKEDVERSGYKIFEDGVSYTEVKELTGCNLSQKERLDLCIGFVCKRAFRGCVPVYDVFEIDKYMEEKEK